MFQYFNPVNKTTLYGPKFKYTDIVRLQPVVRMAIECNPDIYEEDAALIQENQENQRTLRTLSQYAVQISLIRECLTLNHANEILLLVWTRALEGNNTTNQQRFHRLVQHVTTWFSSRCERCQYFNIFMTKSNIYNFNDGIGYTGQDERLLIEASSGGLEEDLDHILGDSLKLLENLAAILNTYRAKYLNSNKTTLSRLKVFVIQCVKTTITLVSVSATGDGKFLYHTPRTSQIPTTFDEQHDLLSLFELLAYLLDICQEQDEVITQLQKEHTSYVEVPKDNLLRNAAL
ncbi:hypothetical protein G6F62_009503 [Rhizopus arrhizus]|nr:hypothetical protein G6F62_009503 [Rhizopus arrhizus]KAG1370710.1 hypothetical protein G6F61_011807 [Rhizopus arrhizus]